MRGLDFFTRGLDFFTRGLDFFTRSRAVKTAQRTAIFFTTASPAAVVTLTT